MNSSVKSLKVLSASQQPLVGGWHPRPFHGKTGEFRSGRTRAELDQQQPAQIIKIPTPRRTPPILALEQVVGSQAVGDITDKYKQLVFHTVGDTGAGKHSDQGQVAQIMELDFERPNAADRPAFFLHLGDVCYNEIYGTPQSKAKMYQPQFYSPYSSYPGKIIAIPGNHDSNPQEDPKAIDAFEDNFCAPLPTAAADLNALINALTRQPMYQPGVYFRLDAPFVNILCLFSNGGEKEGVIQGGIAGNAQMAFIKDQLSQIKQDRSHGKAFVVAVHHPPFSGGGGHIGSATMLGDLDQAFNDAGIAPDALLAGHSHLYQRFTRRPVYSKIKTKMEVPYIVAGMGGHGITPLKPTLDHKPVKTPLKGAPSANGQAADHSLQQYFNGFGHVVVTVDARSLTIDMIGTKTNSAKPVDSVTVDLQTSKITHETAAFKHPAKGEE